MYTKCELWINKHWLIFLRGYPQTAMIFYLNANPLIDLIDEPMLFNYPGLTWLDLLGLHNFQPPAAQGFRAVQVSPPSEHAQGLPLGWVQSGRWKHQLQCRMHRSLFIFFWVPHGLSTDPDPEALTDEHFNVWVTWCWFSNQECGSGCSSLQ